VTPTWQVTLFALVPVVAMAVAAVLATARPVAERVRSLLQHFAAGLVTAIVAVELLPDVHGTNPLWVVLGFAIGVAAMLGLRAFGLRLDERVEGTRSNAPLLTTVGIDLLIDGLLLGMAFTLGSSQGALLTLALTVEVMSLGTTVAAQLVTRGASRATAITAPIALSLLVTGGAVLGNTLLGGLSGPAYAIVISFGMAALLYLVVEELLVEAHEEEDTAVGVTAFFVGFIVLLLLSSLE